MTAAHDAPEPDLAEPHLLDTPQAGGLAIRGSAVRAAGFAVIAVLGLISAPLLTRHLGIVDFGRYTQVVSLIAIVGTVTEAGLGVLAVRELSLRRAEDRTTFLRDLLGVRLVLTLAGVAAAVLFAALVGYGSTLVWGTLAAGVGLVAYVWQAAFALPLAAELRLGWMTIADVLRHAVFVALIVALVVAGAGLVPLLAVPIAAGSAAWALTAWLVRGTVPWRPRVNARAWAVLLRETLPLAAAGAFYNVYFRVVVLLMSLLAAGVETGWFALSFRIIEVLVAVPFLVIGSLLPLLTRAARDDAERFAFGFSRTLEVALIAGVWMTLATALGAHVGIAYLTDDPSAVAVDTLRIQSFALLAVFLNVAYGSALIALRRNRALVVVNGTALVVTVIVAVALIPGLGARGGALATVIGEWTLTAGYAFALHRDRGGLLPAVGVFPRLVVAAGAAVAAGATVAVPWLPNLAAAAVASLVYFAVLGVLGGIPRELLDALSPRRWRARR